MKVLVINAGSSSLKYQLLDTDNQEVLAKGLCERIGIDGKFTYKAPGKETIDAADVAMPTHSEAIQAVLNALVDEKNGVISSMKEIEAVGHRVVHGGETFACSVKIDEKVMAALEECIPLAPLHNPANITGIKACEAVMGKDVPQVGVFDTAFHQTMPAKAPADCCGRFPVSGNYFFRTGWDENASYTYLHNGPLGSSHGHVDLTHISNYFCGRPFLVDSGRYSYVEEEPLRGMLKDGEAHNVCIIDDARAGLADGSWSYAFFGDSLKNYEKTIEDIHYGEMPFLSREPEGGPAFHNRQVLIFPEGIWFISDDLRMEGTHKSRCRFHFSPEVAVVKELPESGEVLLENSGIRLKLGACEPLEKERVLLSRRYNETEEHWVFTTSRI